MATNNFERLFEEENERFEERQRSPETQSIDNSLWRSMGLIRLIGHIFNLFVPRAEMLASQGNQGPQGPRRTAPSQPGNNPQDIQPRSPSAPQDPRKDG